MSSAPEILPGAVLIQKYRVEEILGRGGMGVVLAARHLALGERVAIKVLSGRASTSREALARLEREARILARIRNEHVVRVIDLGQLDGGTPFIVMEYLPGRDLGSVLAQQGRLPPELAVGVALQTSVALAAAHSSGVVHRDLKPENLFCLEQDDGQLLVKVLDFGVSRLERADEQEWVRTSVTDTNTVIGTPLYMSPEQLRSAKSVDARSDLWSLGVVLYELLSGAPPFTGASFPDVAIKIATEPARPLTSFDPSIDPELAAVVQRCLEKDRDERFASVAELARALLPFGPPGSERTVERVERLALRPSTEPRVIEEISFSSPTALAPAAPPPSSRPTREGEGAAPTRSSTWLRPLSVVALFAAAGLLIAWRLAATSAPSAPNQTRPEGPVTPGREAVHVASGTSSASLQGMAPVIEVTPVSSGQVSLAPGEAAAAVAPSGAAKAERRAPQTNAFAKALCNPPYTLDAQGRKKFRHECFTGKPIQ